MDNNQFTPNNNSTYNYGPQQQPYYNPNYPPYDPNYPPYDPTNEPMTLKDWMLTLLLLMIPIANIILPFVWAFGTGVNKSKKTYFQAYLLFMLIGIIFGFIITIVLISAFSTLAYNLY
jgi:ABC-type multidrug transport system permease subunit